METRERAFGAAVVAVLAAPRMGKDSRAGRAISEAVDLRKWRRPIEWTPDGLDMGRIVLKGNRFVDCRQFLSNAGLEFVNS